MKKTSVALLIAIGLIQTLNPFANAQAADCQNLGESYIGAVVVWRATEGRILDNCERAQKNSDECKSLEEQYLSERQIASGHMRAFEAASCDVEIIYQLKKKNGL